MKMGKEVIIIVNGRFREGFVVKCDGNKVHIKTSHRCYTRTREQVVPKEKRK